MVAPFANFYRKILVGFCLNTGKRFVLKVSFQSQKSMDSSKKAVPGIYKIALRLRDRHVFTTSSKLIFL